MALMVMRLFRFQNSRPGAINVIRRWFSSALYVTGDKASETYAVLTPHLDFERQFEDIEGLKRNVELRGMDLDVDELKNLWDLMKDVQGNRTQLEERRVEIAEKMRALKSSAKSVEVEVRGRQLRNEGKLIRDDLKAVMKGLWALEGNAIIKALALPNCLHVDTPTGQDEKVVHVFGTKPDCGSKSHLEKGVNLDLIKYCNQLNYYLLGDAALFELGALHYFGSEFEKGGFVEFCNADFVRSVVVEGVGMNHADPTGSLMLRREEESASEVDRLHLVGGASLASFAAYHAKHGVHPGSLPLRCFASGRQYTPTPGGDEGGLFSAWQASALELIVCSTDEAMQELHGTLASLTSAYERLGLHFRVAHLPARALRPWESLRASVQMYSAHRRAYVEVANVSLCDDYVSKRLLMCCHDNDKAERRFVKVVSGTAVSVPKLLGCILEQNEDDSLVIPEPIKEHMLKATH